MAKEVGKRAGTNLKENQETNKNWHNPGTQ